MKPIALKADVQVWVCVNAREADARLPSCTRERGERVLEGLRAQLAPRLKERGLSAWMNRTLCQGFCHAAGVTVTIEFSACRGAGLKFQGVAETDLPKVCEAVEAAIGS